MSGELPKENLKTAEKLHDKQPLLIKITVTKICLLNSWFK